LTVEIAQISHPAGGGWDIDTDTWIHWATDSWRCFGYGVSCLTSFIYAVRETLKANWYYVDLAFTLGLGINRRNPFDRPWHRLTRVKPRIMIMLRNEQ